MRLLVVTILIGLRIRIVVHCIFTQMAKKNEIQTFFVINYSISRSMGRKVNTSVRATLLANPLVVLMKVLLEVAEGNLLLEQFSQTLLEVPHGGICVILT
jgi:hypothetical protein